MEQESLNLKVEKKLETVDKFTFEPIKGYPMLQWKGKRPFNSTQYYPAQLKESYGEPVDSWMNEIYWGDNLQVMSHLLKKYRGKLKLVYIDPPYDSNANYKKEIKIKSSSINNDYSVFEEKQYQDIWANDDYLQYMFERLILIRELLAEDGSVWVHLDFRRDSYLRVMMDEIFGQENLRSQIIWNSTRSKGTALNNYGVNHNLIYYYTKTNTKYTFNIQYAEYEPDKLDRYYCFFELNDGSYKKYSKREMRNFRESGKYPEGRQFALIPLLNLNKNRPNLTYEFLGFNETWAYTKDKMLDLKNKNLIVQTSPNAMPLRKQYFDEIDGVKVNTIWNDISPLNSQATEKVDYPTQKPETLLERIILTATNKNDLVFDCFMGSGTTQAVALKLGRKFIGADINLGAIQTTTKRLLNVSKELPNTIDSKYYTGFNVYTVNHYDVFRNPVQAKELLIEALEIQPLPGNNVYDGEKDGRFVKIMPINRIATRADLTEIISNFDYKSAEIENKKSPNKPVISLILVCMGHEPDLAAQLKQELKPYIVDVQVVDILRDKENLEFKRDSFAEVVIENHELVVKSFYPMNLLQKLSIEKENIEDWRELVESIMIDFNYDGSVLEPKIIDVPDDGLVKGNYKIPEDAGKIKIKITDLLSESLELEVDNG